MKNEEKTQIKTSGSSDSVHSVDESRRSISKKGLIAPVIMTLANRSAWGANACVGSGFQSYSDAKKEKRTISHAAANPDGISPYANWKTPGEWGGTSGHEDWPWQDTSSSNRITPMRRHPNDPNRFQRWGVNPNNPNSNPTWRPADYPPNAQPPYGLTQNNARNNWGKSFLDQLLGSGYPTTVTIYLQLQSSVTDLLAYQIATEMNLLVYPVSLQTPDFSLFDLWDFELFYSNCL
jgi:hypothetical protein